MSPSVVDFPTMARAIGELCRAGLVVVIDEFQYVTRSALKSFTSFLQAEVDRLRDANIKQGGLFVLGSLHADMNQLLEDKGASLYGRLTQRIKLDHWDFEDLLDVFRSQNLLAPSQWLTLWTFFEGVPKFYHDAFEQELYQVEPGQFADELLTRMFLRSSSPWSEEADTWFLRRALLRVLACLYVCLQFHEITLPEVSPATPSVLLCPILGGSNFFDVQVGLKCHNVMHTMRRSCCS